MAEKEDAVAVKDLNLPENARVVSFYREGHFFLADEGTKLRKGDEAVILTHSKNLAALHERWKPKLAEDKA